MLQEDLVGKSIYNIIHVGDHAPFSRALLPMSSIGIGEARTHTHAHTRTNTHVSQAHKHLA